jgi:oxygen-independent coproporphyrinogen-3 oxidase
MAGIYIHIPFCKSRCRYCDFFSTTQLEKRTDYAHAIIAEFNDRKHLLTEPIQTIYFGGGTPSQMPVESLRMILEAIINDNTGESYNNDNLDNVSRQSYGEADRSNESEIRTPCRDKENNTIPSYTTLHNPTPYPSPDKIGDVEITLEANPGDITPELAEAWLAMGFNRLSIGIQSFDDNLLQLIGRRHSAEQAKNAVSIAQKAGFDNISIDLMYALPTQSMEQWQKDVQTALQLDIQHISTYGLIYEEGTVLTKLLMDNKLQPVDEEVEMRMYDYLVEQLAANGFVHYEVSNFALSGRHSRHNSSYWNDTTYMGLGTAAHSYDGQCRQWNIADLDGYINQALAHKLSPEIEHLSDEDRHTERVMLSLRTNQGVAKADIDMHKAQPYLEQGLLEEKGERVAATTQGFHILNRIIEELV